MIPAVSLVSEPIRSPLLQTEEPFLKFLNCSLENVSRAGRPLLLRKPEQMRLMVNFYIWPTMAKETRKYDTMRLMLPTCRNGLLWLYKSVEPFGILLHRRLVLPVEENQKERKKNCGLDNGRVRLHILCTCRGMIQYGHRWTCFDPADLLILCRSLAVTCSSVLLCYIM